MSNAELDKLSEWFKSNRLSLNIKKTNYIIFSPKSKCRQQQINSFTIQIDGTRSSADADNGLDAFSGQVNKHSTIPYVTYSFLLCNSNFVFKTRRF